MTKATGQGSFGQSLEGAVWCSHPGRKIRMGTESKHRHRAVCVGVRAARTAPILMESIALDPLGV